MERNSICDLDSAPDITESLFWLEVCKLPSSWHQQLLVLYLHLITLYLCFLLRRATTSCQHKTAPLELFWSMTKCQGVSLSFSIVISRHGGTVGLWVWLSASLMLQFPAILPGQLCLEEPQGWGGGEGVPLLCDQGVIVGSQALRESRRHSKWSFQSKEWGRVGGF